MIRTQLGRFSQELGRAVGPLVERLRGARAGLVEAQESRLADELGPEIENAAHRLEILRRTGDSRRSLVLVHGLQKAGKSTLIDALAGAWVAPVSALPGLPCSVGVAHAALWSARVTRLDGRQEAFPEPTGLETFLQRARDELLEALRAAREAGRELDPVRDLPRGVRRVDLQRPDEALAGSGVVLVEVPAPRDGVRFDDGDPGRGGDVVAAVFVARADHPEPAGLRRELGRLLERHPHVTLVLNLDPSRRDLAPDGALVPCAPCADPAAAVEAFERHAMDAAMREAAAQGRLSIVPVDLLRAASRRLGGDAPSHDDEGRADARARGEAALVPLERAVARRLDGDERSTLFVRDVLRQANEAVGRLEAVLDTPSIDALTDRAAVARRELANGEMRLAALQRLRQAAGRTWEWEGPLEGLSTALEAGTSRRAEELSARTKRVLHPVVDGWFRSRTSFLSLVRDDLVPAFEGCRNELFTHAHRTLVEETARPGFGKALDPALLEDLRRAGLDPRAIGAAAAAALDPLASCQEVPPPLWPEDLPIKKRLGDRLRMRKSAELRAQVLGPLGEPDRQVPVEEKAERFPKPARVELKRTLERTYTEFLGRTTARAATTTFNAFLQALGAELARRAEAEVRELEVPLIALQEEIERLERLHGELVRAREARSAAHDALARLVAELGWSADDLAAAVPPALAARLAPDESEGSEEEDGDEAYEDDEVLAARASVPDDLDDEGIPLDEPVEAQAVDELVPRPPAPPARPTGVRAILREAVAEQAELGRDEPAEATDAAAAAPRLDGPRAPGAPHPTPVTRHAPSWDEL